MTGLPWRSMMLGAVLTFGLLTGCCHARPHRIPRQRPVQVHETRSSPVLTVADLKRMQPEQLEQLYAQAEAGSRPVGYVRGEILHLSGTFLPRVKAKMAGLIWRGKYFNEEGGFINQWTGFRAVDSQADYGPSYYDGRPSLILQYPEEVLYFGKMRDEAREVAPGVWLAMVFERTGQHKFRGYIGLELAPPKKHRH